MRYSLALLAAAAVVSASPVALPQGVTTAISPIAPPPPGCTGVFVGAFGIAIMNISTAFAKSKRQVSTLSE